MRARALVGRSRELAVVRHAVAAGAEARGGGALVLVGPAGVGKSRLRAEGEALARERGYRVLSGRAVGGGSRSAFRPLSEALLSGFRDSGPPRDRSLLPLLPTLSLLVPPWASARSAPSADVPPLALAEALLQLLAHVRSVEPVLLVLEDAHWADADTLAVWEYLVDNASAHGALCLTTLRPEGEAHRIARELADRRAATLVELAPLADEHVDEVALSCLGQDAAPEELLAFVRAHADGLPFAVEELLAALQRSGALVPSPAGWRVVGPRLRAAPPATASASIAERLRALAPRTQQVLFTAALLGRHFDWRLLPAATGLGAEVVDGSLREASYAQIVEADGDEVRFRHALTREHVLALLLPPERVRLATAALRALDAAHAELPAELEQVAADLAVDAGDPGRAVRHLVRAAEQARSRAALSAAAGLLQQARALTGDPAEVLAIDVRLAAVRALAGEVEEALSLGRRALGMLRRAAGGPAAGEAQEVELQRTLGRAALGAGRLAEAAEAAAAASTRATAAGDTALLARALALEAHVAVEGGRLEEARATAARVLEDDGGAAEARCEALEVLGRCARLHDLAAAEAAFEAARRTAEGHGLLVWRARALHELGTIDLLDTMRLDRLAAARRAAMEAGAPVTVAHAEHHLAFALVARGQTAEGRRAADRAVAIAERFGLSVLGPALVVVARSHAHERDDAALAPVLRRLAALEGDEALMAQVHGHVHALRALADADRDGGLAALDAAVEVLRQHPDQHFPNWGAWALLRTLAGRDDAAARAEAAQAAGSDTRFNRALLGAAEAVALGRSRDPSAGERFGAAVAELAVYERSDWLVHGTRWLASPAALSDGWGEPVRWLQAALGHFTGQACHRLATSCRTLLRDAGAPVPRRGRGSAPVPAALRGLGVTSREMDVLQLLEERLSNREIAERLVLSPRTVEKHVASLLRKTGAGDRAALPGVAATAGR